MTSAPNDNNFIVLPFWEFIIEVSGFILLYRDKLIQLLMEREGGDSGVSCRDSRGRAAAGVPIDK